MSGTYITSETREQRVPRGSLMMLALLAMSGFISYLDRSNLSIAASMLKDDLGISAAPLGISSSRFSEHTVWPCMANVHRNLWSWARA